MSNQEWLDLHQEEILDPELPICDPHHHLWHVERLDYRVEVLLDDIGRGHNVQSTVYIECGQGYRSDAPAGMAPVGENEFVLAELARVPDAPVRVAEGIVAHADLRLGAAVAEVLQAHREASGGRLRGIRHANAWDSSEAISNSHSGSGPYLLADPKFREGFAQLARHDLAFDAWLYQQQIPELTSLARAFPDTRIVFDHLGGPLLRGPWAEHRDAVFARWHEAVAELAECPNVYAKLGGAAMAMNGFDWHKRERPPTSEQFADFYRGWFRHCIERFTPQRCMYESNFPMDRTSVSYPVLWNAFKRISAEDSADERARLFFGTAAEVYRLRGPAS
ncbi:MAG: amidohydrolase family protein [Gammaproteobacteria bacterium AqS3]|nr:amidohydrolase family protein [Gammaproteobacteria bacterium AqS3]